MTDRTIDQCNNIDVVLLAKQAGMNAMVGKTTGGKYHPNVSAIARSIPVEWLQQFAELVRNEVLKAAPAHPAPSQRTT